MMEDNGNNIWRQSKIRELGSYNSCCSCCSSWDSEYCHTNWAFLSAASGIQAAEEKPKQTRKKPRRERKVLTLVVVLFVSTILDGQTRWIRKHFLTPTSLKTTSGSLGPELRGCCRIWEEWRPILSKFFFEGEHVWQIHLGADLCHFDIPVQFSLHYYAIFMHETMACRMCTNNVACACIKMA